MNKLDQEKKCWLPLIPPSAPPDAPHCSHSRHTSASAASAAYAPPNQKLALPTLPSSSQLPQFPPAVNAPLPYSRWRSEASPS
ncbi:MAG: hypothetical protein HON98_08420 [Chloroflexi bacterium]|nr:hypothetical protein [Chloroflexota bacterium]MBT4534630.1 hypothetical protein [Chloroflexota bacterium]MBT4755692.1 hypothetical protein [Chloroflexota bacterium]MBT5335649.1 hypothetical protein [Chloroflexota bacterium]MBT6152671.1 hypothetical protein [Chloroflexota bacterium]